MGEKGVAHGATNVPAKDESAKILPPKRRQKRFIMDIQTIASSSGGNCSLVTAQNTYILVDAGVSMRRITRGLASRGLVPESLDGIVITHEHTDHIKGLAMVLKYWDTAIYATAGTAAELYRMLPQSRGRISVISPDRPFGVGNVEVTAVPIPHDAAEPVGYIFAAGGKRAAQFTDVGKITRRIVEAAEGAESVVLEANHDIEMLKNGAYPYYLKARILSDRGHLSNSRCGDFAAWLAKNGTKNIVLAHLSRENNRPETAYDTVSAAMEDLSARIGLFVAPPDDLGQVCVC